MIPYYHLCVPNQNISIINYTLRMNMPKNKTYAGTYDFLKYIEN